MDFSDEPQVDTENVEYFETDPFDTSEQYDFGVTTKKSVSEKVRLQLSDFYSDETHLNRDLLWKYLIYINLLREKEMNYSDYHIHCHEKLKEALEKAKMQITQGMINQPLEVDDLDAFFDELESKIDKFASKCVDCLEYKLHPSSIQITDTLCVYGPVVISVLSQLKTLTLRLRESKRRKLAKCTGKLLECMKQVGMAICDARHGDFKSKTFDLTSKMNDMQGRNDFFMQYRSNLILRYLDQRDSIVEFLNSTNAEAIIGDPDFNFSSEFLHLLQFHGDFTENVILHNESSQPKQETTSRMHEDLDTAQLQEKTSPQIEFIGNLPPNSYVFNTFDLEMDTNSTELQNDSNDTQVASQIDTKALELARNKAAAILR